MYTTNTKAGLSAARRIPAPEMMTSTFIPGMANRFVSKGGGWRREDGDGRHVRVQTHVPGRGGGTGAGRHRERNTGTRN